MSASDNLSARLAERVIDRRAGVISRIILHHLCRYVADTALELGGSEATIDDAMALLDEALAALKRTSEVEHACALGGKARAAALTPERRSEIARQAARARWKDRIPR